MEWAFTGNIARIGTECKTLESLGGRARVLTYLREALSSTWCSAAIWRLNNLWNSHKVYFARKGTTTPTALHPAGTFGGYCAGTYPDPQSRGERAGAGRRASVRERRRVSAGCRCFVPRSVLMRNQELAEDKNEGIQPGQNGKPYEPRALVPPYHCDQADDPSGQPTLHHEDAVEG